MIVAARIGKAAAYLVFALLFVALAFVLIILAALVGVALDWLVGAWT